MIKFYNYYSYWIFFWFILYKLKIIKIQPSFNYIFINIFSIFLIISNLQTNKNFNYTINSDIIKIVIIVLLNWLIIDVIPLFFLIPFKLDTKTLIANIVILLIYLLFMKIIYNYKVNNIIHMYKEKNSNIFNISFNKWFNNYLKFLAIND